MVKRDVLQYHVPCYCMGKSDFSHIIIMSALASQSGSRPKRSSVGLSDRQYVHMSSV